MDIKQYIDRFDDISDLQREQQFSLLEQARDEIQSKTLWPSFKVIAFIVRATFLIVLTGGSYIIWGLSSWGLIVSVLMGLLLSRVAITEINDRLMLKGLKVVLPKKAAIKEN